MVSCAIYARFSSDRQNERSVDDQVHICAERANSQGWTVEQVYSDYAISGATRDRPGLNAMLEAGDRFDVIVAESLDRLSRDQEDIAHIFKALRFAGTRIYTLADGEVSEFHIGVKGAMSATFLKDLGDKVRRGQIGNARAGRIPGGRSYGYRPVYKLDGRGRPEGGWAEVDEDQADAVRRIYREYLAGRSPLAIAHDLNRDGVVSPRGGEWNASTIMGSRKRANGILHNALYAGRVVYNRQRFEKHPVTRKRLSKPNPREQWVETQVEELRIIDEPLWQAVQHRLAAHAHRSPGSQRRPKRLLSGLVECGICGGTVTVLGNERWGCSTRRNRGTCTNATTISTRQLENRVVEALKHRMLTPEWVEEFVDEWHLLTAEENQRRRTARGAAERQLAKAQGRIDRLTRAIADGLGEYDEIKARLTDAYNERATLEAELADQAAIELVPMHPAIAQEYRRWVENMQANLASGNHYTEEFRNSLRPHIGKVVMTPSGSRGAALELHGVLAAILNAIGAAPKRNGADCTLKLVAGGCNHLHLLYSADHTLKAPTAHEAKTAALPTNFLAMLFRAAA